MSIAQNHLEQIPASVLNLTSTTIQYLSLAGNDFHDTVKKFLTLFITKLYKLMITLGKPYKCFH